MTFLNNIGTQIARDTADRRSRTGTKLLRSWFPQILAALRSPPLDRTPLVDNLRGNQRKTNGHQLHIYVAGCRGLQRLVSDHDDLPGLYKIGYDTRGDLMARMAELNRDIYAGAIRDRAGCLIHQDGFDDWFARQIPLAGVTTHQAIRLTPRSIVVTPPEGVSIETFDRVLKSRLLGLALHHRLRGDLRNHPTLRARLTAYSFGSAERVSAAEEIYCISMRRNAHVLLQVVEDVIAEVSVVGHQVDDGRSRRSRGRHRASDGANV